MSDGTPPFRTGKRWSLEGRLRLRLLSGLSIAWLVGSMTAMLGLRHETAEVLDGMLESTAQRLLLLPDALLDNHELLTANTPPPLGNKAHAELLIYRLFDAQGRLLHAHGTPDVAIDANANDGLHEHGDWRVLTITRTDQQRRVQVAERISHRHLTLWGSSLWLLTGLLAMLPLAALSLSLVLRRGFLSMERIRRILDLRPAHQLDPITQHDAPDELLPWIDTINTLMARVQVQIEAERAFAAHTAHELRTPLAAARAQAQRLVRETHEPKVIERGQALVRQLDRLTSLATRMLQLARVESGVALKREEVNLMLLAQIVTDEFSEALQSRELQLRAPTVLNDCTVHADTDAIGIALRNLIDNALKHGRGLLPVTAMPPDTPPLRVLVEVGHNWLSVTDNGPGTPPETLPRLTQPFERGKARRDGTGLGLAMVATIAQQSAARLELHSPVEDGRGFRAVLHFGLVIQRS